MKILGLPIKKKSSQFIYLQECKMGEIHVLRTIFVTFWARFKRTSVLQNNAKIGATQHEMVGNFAKVLA
jgi:hypothetical protein